MHNSSTLAPEPQRSTFVTVIAWIFIVLAGFTAFISVLQNIMIFFMFPADQMAEAMNQPNANEQIPVFAQFMFSNIRLFFIGILVMSLTTLISSIGLLKRKNWARVVFIFIMALGIVWNIFALVMQHFMFDSMPTDMPPEAVDPQFGPMMLVMKVVTYIMAIGISALFAWIIKKLVSQDIKTEFMENYV